ncbi:UNVERIFIED_CONTAM: hypothetical protein Sindi_2395700 [Sesamum indicum]
MATETPGESATPSSPAVVKLKPIEATPESFQEFGQVVEASPDGDEFGPRDAQLDLSHGIPRQFSGRSGGIQLGDAMRAVSCCRIISGTVYSLVGRN